MPRQLPQPLADAASRQSHPASASPSTDHIRQMPESAGSGTPRKPPMQHDMTAALRACVDACHACRTQCLVTVAHGAESGGALAAAPHMQVLLDCAVLCAATVDLLARGSVHHRDLCRVCADVCRACETSCRQMPHGSTVARCAELCAACANACAAVAGAA